MGRVDDARMKTNTICREHSVVTQGVAGPRELAYHVPYKILTKPSVDTEKKSKVFGWLSGQGWSARTVLCGANLRKRIGHVDEYDILSESDECL